MEKLSVTSIIFTATGSLLWILLLIGGIADGLDWEGAKEQPCFEITKTADINFDWIMNVSGDIWYYPLMSRLDLYTTSLEVSHKEVSELQENEVYYDACIQYEMGENNLMETVGFGGSRTWSNVTEYNGTDPNVKGCRFTTESGRSGISYCTLTDNSSFVFHANCMDDNQMTWAVSSANKTLSKETVKLIYNHAESLGFKKEYFTGLRYDECNLS